jgi:hypothetical protein
LHQPTPNKEGDPTVKMRVVLLVAVASLALSSLASADAGACCDCYHRTKSTVCTGPPGGPEICTTEITFDWVDCDGSGGDCTRSSGLGRPCGGGITPIVIGPGPGGGGATTHPDDDTPEAKQESAMCDNDNVLWIRHCNPSVSREIECCFLNSDDGHLCTTCDCGGCCDTYFDPFSSFTVSLNRGCKTHCASEFSGGWAEGQDDGESCGMS